MIHTDFGKEGGRGIGMTKDAFIVGEEIAEDSGIVKGDHERHRLSGRIYMREKLKAARKAKGLTQEKMAEELGITLRYYQNIEAGDRAGNFEIWDRLEDITGIHQRILRSLDHDKEDNP